MMYVKSTDGTNIAVYDPNPCGKDTVLLIHGWPLSHKIFEYQVNLLLDCDFRVVTLDLRGLGNSDAPKCGYCYDQMATDIFMIVKALRLRNFILGGFSMGGAIALRYMRICKGYGVRKLMLFAAAAPIWTQREDFCCGVPIQTADDLIYQASTNRPQLCRDFSHTMLFANPHPESVLDWFEDIALSASGYGTIQTCIALRDEDGRADLCFVHVPTAIFQGLQDKVVPNDLTMYQHKMIPNSVLYNFEYSGHGMIYDELEKFNICMINFICS